MHVLYCANNILYVSALHAHPKHLVPYYAGVSPQLIDIFRRRNRSSITTLHVTMDVTIVAQHPPLALFTVIHLSSLTSANQTTPLAVRTHPLTVVGFEF